MRTHLTCSFSAPTATCTLPSGVVQTGDPLFVKIKVSVEEVLRRTRSTRARYPAVAQNTAPR